MILTATPVLTGAENKKSWSLFRSTKHLMIFNAWQISTGAASCKEAQREKDAEMLSVCLYEEIKWIFSESKIFLTYEMHGKTTIRNESGSVQVYAVYDTPPAQDKAIYIRVSLLRKVSCYA